MASAPFAYGQVDCGLVAVDWIREATGADVAEGLAPYGTAAEAMDAMRAFFGGADVGDVEDIAELIAQAWGIEEVPPLTAQRGDIVLMDTEDGPSLGVLNTGGVMRPAARGLAAFPLRQGRRAWRI